MNPLLIIVLLAIFFALIHWVRRRDERAYRQAIHYCQQQQLQFISIARQKIHLQRYRGAYYLTSSYLMEFSGDHFHLSQGFVHIYSQRYIDFEIPPYPIAN